MSLQTPAPMPVQNESRTRPRQKYSAARAFYLTILVISAITILSLLKERRIQHEFQITSHALFSRTHLTIREGLVHRSNGELVRMDQAVRWSFFEVDPWNHFHEAYDTLLSADSSTLLKINALSSAPTAQMRKQVSFPTYNYTIAGCTRLNRSPLLS